jgi:hypothetical protein
MLDKVRSWLPNPVREVLFLEKAEGKAQALPSELRARVQKLATAAEQRRRAAEVLSDDDQTPAALCLLSDATKLMMSAFLLFNGRDVSEGALDGPALAAEVGAVLGLDEATSPDFASVRAVVGESAPLAFDELLPEKSAERRAALGGFVEMLRRPLELRAPGQIVQSRRIRLGAIALALVAILVWGVVRVVSPKNYARGKVVTMSSRRPGGLPGVGPEGLPPENLVDGSTSSTYDICSRTEPNPWAMVDLKQETKLVRFVVKNRADCCWDNPGAFPLVFEVSSDGAKFTEVARRTTPFTASDPWKIRPAKPVTTRYLRLRVDQANGELVLNELEAYAR